MPDVAAASGTRSTRPDCRPDERPDRPPTRRLDWRPDWRLGLLVLAGILAVVVARNVFLAAHRVLGWAVAAAVVAMLLSPVVRLLDRVIPRALAMAVAVVFVAGTAAGLGALYSSSLLTEVDRLQQQAPEVAERIEQRSDRIGAAARELRLVERVTELVDRLDAAVGSGGDALRSAALSLPAYFVSLILMLFLMVYGPRMVDGALGQLPTATRERLGPALLGAARRTQRYAWATILQALVVAAAIWLVAWLLDLPAPGLLALFGVIAALVPYLGILVAWIPVVVLALGTSPGAHVALAGALAVALQAAEALWWRRLVDPRTLYVGPAIPIVVGALGFAVYGIGGALYSIVLAVFALALTDELSPVDDPLPTPVDEPEG